MAKSRDLGELCRKQEDMWQCPRGWAGEGIPPQCLTKSSFARFLVNSQCFYPTRRVLKGGEGVAPGKKRLESWFLSCTALGCHLGEVGVYPGADPGRRQGPGAAVLLSGNIGLCHLLVAEAPAAHSTFPPTPACTSILGWQIPRAAAVAAQDKIDFAGRCLTLLLGAGPDPALPLQGRHRA